MSKKSEDRDAERRRVALRRIMDQRNLTPASLARRAGLANANAIYNFLHGRSASLSHKTIEDFVKVLPGLVYEDFVDPDRELGEAPTNEANFVYLKGAVRSGSFQDSAEYPPHKQRAVPLPSAVRAPAGMYALEVKDKDGIYKEGTLLFCIPFKQYTRRLKDDRVVIVQRYRHRDGTVETTARFYRVDSDGNPYLEDLQGNRTAFPANYNGGLIELNGDWLELSAIVAAYYTHEED